LGRRAAGLRLPDRLRQQILCCGGTSALKSAEPPEC